MALPFRYLKRCLTTSDYFSYVEWAALVLLYPLLVRRLHGPPGRDDDLGVLRKFADLLWA